MKTDVKVIAGLLASIIWADGEYDAAEKVTLEEIVDALELDAATFNKAIEAELEVVRNKSEEDLNIYISMKSQKRWQMKRLVLFMKLLSNLWFAMVL